MSFETASLDQVREYWDKRPCNIRHSQKPVGSREYFDEVERRKYFVEPHIPVFAEFERWKGKRVLEIGCGIGTDTINFTRAGAFVTAVDLSEESLKVARQRAAVYGVGERIRFYAANAENLASVVPAEAYDLIYSFGVIHHTPRPDRVIEQLRSYTKPGTTLKIMVYYRRSWKVLWILLKYGKARFWQAAELTARYSEAQTGCPVTYTYNYKEAKRLLKPYRVVRMQPEHIFSYRIADYVRYEYKKVWYFRWMSPALFHWLECHFGWHLLITAEA